MCPRVGDLVKAAFLGNPDEIYRVFAGGRRETIEGMGVDLLPGVACLGDPRLVDVEVIFSTWGMPLLNSVELDAMPNLRALFYAAGAVGYFCAPLVHRGVQISSAWQANATPVAEFTLSQILLSCKGYFANVREYAATFRPAVRGLGSYRETVAILGAGAVGSRVIKLLRAVDLSVLVFDPYLSDAAAEDLGANKVSLEAAFHEGYVVSNHLRDTEDTKSLISGRLFTSMRKGATFINTGRGRTVATSELVSVLRERPDLTALLDVTDPEEPLPPGHPLWSLPNVFLSSHIAGSVGQEVLRLADYAIEEFGRYLRGEALHFRVFE